MNVDTNVDTKRIDFTPDFYGILTACLPQHPCDRCGWTNQPSIVWALEERRYTSREGSRRGVVTRVEGVARTMDEAEAAVRAAFENRDSWTEAKAAYERQIEDLYAEIGRLTTHVNFLKKKLPS